MREKDQMLHFRVSKAELPSVRIIMLFGSGYLLAYISEQEEYQRR